MHVLLLSLLVVAVAADSGSLGCYSTVDTSNYKEYGAYETQSLCALSCGSAYPYVAIKNGGYCYCLSELPSSDDETDSSSCDVPCNGYGSVMCGGSSAYTVFTGLGTASAAVLSASTSSKASSSSKSSSSSALSSSASSSKTSSASLSSSADASTTSFLSAQESVATTTLSENGSVAVLTVTRTSDSTSSADASSSSSATAASSGKKLTNVGPIVGGVVGGIAALALIGAAVFFFRRRSHDDDEDDEEFYEKGAGAAVTRGQSKNKSKKYNSAFDMPMANPFVHPLDEFADKRASRMTANGLTDPRLNPVLMGRRRLSEGSLADEADYSRKILAVANP